MTKVVHVIPVGTSVLANLGKPDVPVPAGSLVPEQTPDGAPTPRELIRKATGPDAALDLADLLGAAQLGQLGRAKDRYSAEWTSTGAAVLTPRPTPGDEAFVVLASDTAEGLTAAIVVAARYAATTTRVGYVDDPVAAMSLIQAGEVTVCRLPGLDLAKGAPEDQTWQALGAIGRQIRKTCECGDEWRIVLHLNGGYKALVPHLLVLATAINTDIAEDGRSGNIGEVRAFVLHEDSRYARSKIVWIPVGTLPESQLGQLRRLAATLRGGNYQLTDDWDSELRGQFIDGRGDERRALTASGWITVGVL